MDFIFAKKLTITEAVLQINRNQTCLPVMAMHNIRLIAYHRKDGKLCLGKECKFLHIFMDITIRSVSCKIVFIVNEIKPDLIMHHFEDTDVLTSLCHIHIKAGDKVHLFLPFRLDTPIVRNDHPHLILFFVKIFWQRTYYISKSPCLYKRNTF